MTMDYQPTKGTVLVVDDEPGVRELSRRILTGAGYNVVDAENGQAALDVLKSGATVDFLMVDLDMPVMRGEEMAAVVREQRPDLRILYVTAHSAALFRERKPLRDGEAFLDKPFTAAGLLEAVSLLKRGYINDPAPAAAAPPPPASFLDRLSNTLRRRQ